MENLESKTVELPTIDSIKAKCSIWKNIKPQKTIEGKFEYGPKNLTKMKVFLRDNKFFREDYQYYLSLPTYRLENESYIFYCERRKFQNALLKYKTTIRKFIFINTVEKLQNEQHQEELQKTA